jgi:hypothetical protein
MVACFAVADVMPFGQYAGMRYRELVAKDLNYSEWLLSQSWLDPVVAARLRAAVADYRDDNREDELLA